MSNAAALCVKIPPPTLLELGQKQLPNGLASSKLLNTYTFKLPTTQRQQTPAQSTQNINNSATTTMAL